MAIAHPEILKLFENWLEELEEEVHAMRPLVTLDPVSLAEAYRAFPFRRNLSDGQAHSCTTGSID
jgi:hypothetical protein